MRALYLITLFLILSCFVLSTQTLGYEDLEDIGFQNCPRKNNCQQIRNTPFLDRNCECDRSCSTYNDCCINAGQSRRSQRARDVCMQYGKMVYHGAYTIEDCPGSYGGPSMIRNMCRSGNASDPVLSTPVTDTRNRKTYRNHYCALCNDASQDDLQMWNVTVSCENSDSGDFSLRDLVFRSDLGKWGIRRGGRFDACEFGYDKPDYITAVRMCRANVISTCPASYRRQAYKRACESYMSVVIGRGVVYRNPHCAICNGVSSDKIVCFSVEQMGKKSNKPFSFALLLDVNRSDGDIVGESNRCGSGQKYDPFFGKCRSLKCAIPGFRREGTRCVKQ